MFTTRTLSFCARVSRSRAQLPPHPLRRAYSAAAAASGERAAASRGCLALRFADGAAFDLHPVWLRERCRSPRSVQPATRQRIFEISELAALPVDEVASTAAGAETSDTDGQQQGEPSGSSSKGGSGGRQRVSVVAARVREVEQEVVVTFSDGHESVFDVQELRAEATDARAWGDAAGGWWLPPVQHWDAAAFDATPFFEHELCLTELGQHAMLTQLHSHGAVIVRGVPPEPGGVEKFGSSVGPLRRTNWGTVFEVRANMSSADETLPELVDEPVPDDAQDLEDLAYTNEPLALHVDNPYRHPVPGYQLLHCLVAADGGGESTIVDGWKVAEQLRELDPDAFLTLTRVKTRFQYEASETALVTFHPAITTRPSSARSESVADPLVDPVRTVVYSSRLDFTPPLPPAELDRYYTARAKFHALLHDPQNVYETKLNAGDLLIVDNSRVLHGRRGFDAAEGQGAQPRWVRGCYFDRDATTSKYWVLSRRLSRRLVTNQGHARIVAAEAVE